MRGVQGKGNSSGLLGTGVILTEALGTANDFGRTQEANAGKDKNHSGY
jgi:hypothetical protein